jgi:hypothetical protein
MLTTRTYESGVLCCTIFRRHNVHARAFLPKGDRAAVTRDGFQFGGTQRSATATRVQHQRTRIAHKEAAICLLRRAFSHSASACIFRQLQREITHLKCCGQGGDFWSSAHFFDVALQSLRRPLSSSKSKRTTTSLPASHPPPNTTPLSVAPSASLSPHCFECINHSTAYLPLTGTPVPLNAAFHYFSRFWLGVASLHNILFGEPRSQHHHQLEHGR